MNEKANVKTKSTKSFKPNIIDFLVVVVIVAVIAGVAARAILKYSSPDAGNSELTFESVRVSFRLADISESTAEYFNNGDEFFSISHESVFGTLETFQTNPAEIYVADQEGILHKQEAINDRVDMTGTFISEGVFTEDGFMLQGDGYLIPNSEVYVKSASVTAYILITDVERITLAEE